MCLHMISLLDPSDTHPTGNGLFAVLHYSLQSNFQVILINSPSLYPTNNIAKSPCSSSNIVIHKIATFFIFNNHINLCLSLIDSSWSHSGWSHNSPHKTPTHPPSQLTPIWDISIYFSILPLTNLEVSMPTTSKLFIHTYKKKWCIPVSYFSYFLL